MIDILYIVGSVLFFSLMLAYTAACNRLGRVSDATQAREDAR